MGLKKVEDAYQILQIQLFIKIMMAKQIHQWNDFCDPWAGWLQPLIKGHVMNSQATNSNLMTVSVEVNTRKRVTIAIEAGKRPWLALSGSIRHDVRKK